MPLLQAIADVDDTRPVNKSAIGGSVAATWRKLGYGTFKMYVLNAERDDLLYCPRMLPFASIIAADTIQ